MLVARVPKGTYGYLSLSEGTSYLGYPRLVPKSARRQNTKGYLRVLKPKPGYLRPGISRIGTQGCSSPGYLRVPKPPHTWDIQDWYLRVLVAKVPKGTYGYLSLSQGTSYLGYPGLLIVRVPKGTDGYLSLSQGTSYLGYPGLLVVRVPKGT